MPRKLTTTAKPYTTKAALKKLRQKALADFTKTHRAREEALRLSRETIRRSADSIRATHRNEFSNARKLVKEAADLISKLGGNLKNQPKLYFAGYVEDAQKEFTEASATLAFIEGDPIPDAKSLGVNMAPYMNGLAEAASELRRYILDSLRKDDFSRCEELLDIMDQVYTILVSMDFPDAVTNGLRRNTDMVRGVLERTRGDLTVALRQRRLEQSLAQFSNKISS